MKQFWKSYHVFLPQIWLKLLVYVGYPLVVLGLTGFFVDVTKSVVASCSLAGGLIVSLELLLDGLVFEGIASKDTNKLEYLKTSVRGMKTLRNSIVIDAIRRVISAMIVLGALCAMSHGAIGLPQVLVTLFITLGCTELGLMVTRSITVMMGMLVSVYLGAPLCINAVEMVLSGGNIWIRMGITCICYLLIVIIGRIMIMRKARGSYYDK